MHLGMSKVDICEEGALGIWVRGSNVDSFSLTQSWLRVINSMKWAGKAKGGTHSQKFSLTICWTATCSLTAFLPSLWVWSEFVHIIPSPYASPPSVSHLNLPLSSGLIKPQEESWTLKPICHLQFKKKQHCNPQEHTGFHQNWIHLVHLQVLKLEITSTSLELKISQSSLNDVPHTISTTHIMTWLIFSLLSARRNLCMIADDG